jgi:hypothetical protein
VIKLRVNAYRRVKPMMAIGAKALQVGVVGPSRCPVDRDLEGAGPPRSRRAQHDT